MCLCIGGDVEEEKSGISEGGDGALEVRQLGIPFPKTRLRVTGSLARSLPFNFAAVGRG